MVGYRFETGVVILEVREDGKNHPGDARLTLAGPFGPDAIIYAAVGLKSSVEKEPAGLVRLGAVCWQTEVTKQEHCVGGGSPLWRVEPRVGGLTASPCARWILFSEQAGSPSSAGYLAPFLLDGTLWSASQVPQGLPTDRGIAIEEPLDQIRPGPYGHS